MENSQNLEAIAAIKKRINEIAFSPLEEHGKKFDEINKELFDLIKTLILMIFSYYFGTKNNSKENH